MEERTEFDAGAQLLPLFAKEEAIWMAIGSNCSAEPAQSTSPLSFASLPPNRLHANAIFDGLECWLLIGLKFDKMRTAEIISYEIRRKMM